ncbi:hypothetical protein [Chamaesiphon polymorphus]|uniref:Uncharacterized protein n=1 Tax=Chamaesiphon polymorphus CCALA 037 TaxID=2107692 RepID=A0A2T1GDT1_9CYAN|nr:hypothetical protein [Chamaesiphon polymorphus]PSB55665.1 hypothetical protein C7B77_14340 [Chamaesiphon polymorphus CCALA 037]
MSKRRIDRSLNFVVLFASLFSSLSVTFLVLKYVFNWHYPIATLYRMFAYHNQYPFQYIAIVSVVFGIVGSHWVDRYDRTKGILRWQEIAIVMLLTIVISSPFGGMLWQIHDMQHGFMPQNYLGKIFQGISWGLAYGWLIALLSIPMNLVGLTVGYFSLDRLEKHSSIRNRS